MLFFLITNNFEWKHIRKPMLHKQSQRQVPTSTAARDEERAYQTIKKNLYKMCSESEDCNHSTEIEW